MGLRSFFQRKPSSAAPSPADGTQDDVLSPEDLAYLDEAWADLAAAAEASAMTNFHACTRTGRPGSKIRQRQRCGSSRLWRTSRQGSAHRAGPPGAGPSWFSLGKDICGFSVAEPVVMLPRRESSLVPGARCQRQVVRGSAKRRSVAGAWLLWFAVGGGPPEVREVPGPIVVSGRAAALGDQPPGTLSGYSVSAVCLSMMICSTALAVYPQEMSWLM
jgi:hypothetical protein